MIMRVAIDELFRCSPTDVRCRWALRDFVAAHAMLDIAEDERAKARAEAERGGRGR